MTKKLVDDCFLTGKARLRHDEALAILKARIRPFVGVERVGLDSAAGRVLAAPAVAGRPVPAHTNAAVDGFSFASSDVPARDGASLPIAGRAAAGHPLGGPTAAGSAVRIFTGAVLPIGHDTVVMQEDAEVAADGGAVTIPGGLKRGANVRRAGEDVKEGETLIGAGAVIRPQDLAGLASVGLAEVPVFASLRVAIVSSGDEVVRPGADLLPGQVYDANAPMLKALIASTGAQATDLGVLPDDQATVRGKLAEAARAFDVVITSGGASRGEEDHLAAAIAALGHRHLWQLAIKPGRPMAFGQIGDCAVLGLPGNPVAVFVCFLLYVWPMLRRMGGAAWPEPTRFRLPAAFAFPDRKTGRREFWRGILRSECGRLAVDKFARDGSGLITGLRVADGLIEISEDVPEVRPGDPVDFIPFSEFGIVGR